jgi:HEAT repeat protein
MHTVRGSTRFLLIAVLAAAAVLLAASVAVLMQSDAPVDDEGSDDGQVRLFPTGESDERSRDHVRSGEGGGDDEDMYDQWEVNDGTRLPHGDVFTVTPDTLRGVLEDRHWEEIRRQIGVLQRDGGEVPQDVVLALIALFDGSDTRIDAVLALGDVRSDSAGKALAEHAANLSQPLEVRAAALDALAKNGSQAALTIVQTIASDPGIDPKLLRHACPALAKIGGQDAARTLVDLLTTHQDTRLEGMLVQALGTAHGGGEVLAQTMRQARDGGDGDMALLVVRVARLHGADADVALRAEVRRLVEDPTSLEFAGDDDAQLRLRGSALTAASAIGGDLLDPVIRIVLDDSAGLGNVALHCLRKARGDEAAKKFAPLLDTRTTDARFQREVVVILGETRSFEATDDLVRMMDAEDLNTRHAAAHGLALVRDPAATKALLQRLDSADDDFTMRKNVIEALGTVLANEALPKLRELRETDDEQWAQLVPWVRRAIARIESGNPDTTRLE